MVEHEHFTINQRENIKDYFQKDMHVLEIGCGTGRLSFALAHLVKRWHAVDPSEDSITEAKRLRSRYKHRSKISFKVAQGENTGFKRRFYKPLKKKFDIVFFSFSLHFLENPLLGLEEAYRVLKPGGRVIILEPEKKSYFMTLFSMIDADSHIKKVNLIADMEKAITSVSQENWFEVESISQLENDVEGSLDGIAGFLESNIRSLGNVPKHTIKDLRQMLMETVGIREHYLLPHFANLWVLRKP